MTEYDVFLEQVQDDTKVPNALLGQSPQTINRRIDLVVAELEIRKKELVVEVVAAIQQPLKQALLSKPCERLTSFGMSYMRNVYGHSSFTLCIVGSGSEPRWGPVSEIIDDMLLIQAPDVGPSEHTRQQCTNIDAKAIPAKLASFRQKTLDGRRGICLDCMLLGRGSHEYKEGPGKHPEKQSGGENWEYSDHMAVEED